MTELDLVKGALDIAIRRETQTLLKKRADAATALAIEELRSARIDPSEAALREDVAGMLVTFFMAMAQGAAFKNLRVIAKVLAHKAANSKERADDFIMWANAIGGLLHEEAVLLATLHKHSEAAKTKKSTLDEQHAHTIKATKEELVGSGKLIDSDDEFEALCGALARTGFIILVSAWGGMTAAPAPRLAKLARMANLQAWADDAVGQP